MTEIRGCSTVKMIVASAAGSGMYSQALILQDMLSKELRDETGRAVPVVPEARAGGMGAIAAIALEQSDKNCTVLLGGNGALTAGRGGLNVPKALDLAKVRPIGMTGRFTMYLTLSKRLTDRLRTADPSLNFERNATPADRAKIFATIARISQAEPIVFGSPGVATLPHLAMLDMRDRGGVRFEHIPFKSGAESASAAKRGDVDMIFDVPPTMKAYASDSGVFVLATTAGSERPLGALGTIPPLARVAGKDMEYTAWFGVVAPSDGKNTEAYREALERVIASKSFGDKLASLDNEPGGAGRELGDAIAANLTRFGKAYTELAAEVRK